MTNDESISRVELLEQRMLELQERFTALEARLTPPDLPTVGPRAAESPSEEFPTFVEPLAEQIVELDVAPTPPPIIDLRPRAGAEYESNSASVGQIPGAIRQKLMEQGSPLSPPTAKPNTDNSSSRIRSNNGATGGSEAAAIDHDAFEYKLGINGLLRGGAIVILLAFLFLAAVMVSRGYVTPPIQFAGEILLCLGFAAIGFWKRDEQEEFGQLMVGIGSAGLYASFAGGHLYKHLFSGEVLVALYVMLSLMNLGYAHLRTSKSFLVIGMLGGYAAAMMPMRESKAVLDLCLHALILIPSAAVTLRNRWYGMSIIGWILSFCALIPVLSSDGGQLLRMGALYANSAVGLYVCGRLFSRSDFDEEGLLLSAIVFITGFVGFSVESHPVTPWHVAIWSAVATGVGSLLPAAGTPRVATWAGALSTFSVFFPMGFRPLVAAYLFAIEAILLGSIALRRLNTGLFGLSLIAYAMSIGAYCLKLGSRTLYPSPLQLVPEILLLGLMATSIVLTVRFCRKQFSPENADLWQFFGSISLVGFFVRATIIVVSRTGLALDWGESGLLALAVAALICTLAAVRTKRLGDLGAAGMIGVVSGSAALVREPSATPQWVTFGLLVLTAVNASLAAIHALRTGREEVSRFARIGLGVLLSVIFLRTIQIAGNHRVGSFNEETVVYLGFGILNLVWTCLSYRLKSFEATLLAWISWVFCISVAIGVKASQPIDWLPTLLQATAFLSLITLYAITPRRTSDEAAVTGMCALAGWTLATLLLTEFLTKPIIRMNSISAMSASWVVYALILMIAGFRFDRRHLRYASLAVFAITIAKVGLIDLAELDSLIRVGILLLLGVVMIGTGYWYILWHRKRQEPEP